MRFIKIDFKWRDILSERMVIDLPDEIIRKIIHIKNGLVHYERFQKVYESYLYVLHLQLRFYMIQCKESNVSKHLLDRIHGRTTYTNIVADEVYLYSMQIYKNKLMSLISQTDNETETIVSIQKPYKELFKSLFNISILSLDYLSKKNQKSKKEIMEVNRDLFIRKNKDYGNSFEDFKLIGILVRLNDKINRICTLLEKRSTGPQVNDEAIEDTINDLYNYGILALMYK